MIVQDANCIFSVLMSNPYVRPKEMNEKKKIVSVGKKCMEISFCVCVYCACG